MKPLSIPLAIGLLALSGCADPLEQRSTGEVQQQFERGVTGQGTIGPLERTRMTRQRSTACRKRTLKM